MRFLMMILLACTAVLPAHAHESHGKPQYGGQMAEAGLFQGELVVQGKSLTLYLTEHGKPLSSQGAKARLTLLAAGSKSEHVMQAGRDNRLTLELPAAPAAGSKLVVSITLQGDKNGSLRFVLP